MIRKSKQILAGILAVMMVLASAVVLMPEQVSAASQPKLSAKSVIVKAGGTRQIKVIGAKGKVKWKTTDGDIASIKSVRGKNSQIVRIKAGKKAGLCKIAAKVGGKTLVCKVKVSGKVTMSSSTVNLSSKYKTGSKAGRKADRKFKAAYSDFAFRLLQNTVAIDVARGNKVNTLVSPESVLTALVMTENGARGDTLREMKKTIAGDISIADYNKYLSSLNRRMLFSYGVSYNVANSIWVSKNTAVKKNFIKKNKMYHRAEVFKAPFNDATVKDMNSWVSGNTNKMIRKIINDLSPEDRMVLINVITFEGEWEHKFDDPGKAKFTTDDGAVVRTDMLSQMGSMEYLTLNGGKGFVKHYKGREVSFVGLLPPEGTSVDDYLAGISGKAFSSAWAGRKTKTLEIMIPEFKYDYSRSMKGVLKAMGMKRAFTEDADFTGMITPASAQNNIYIGDVLHKTHIELDQNGTKAAAATAVIAKESSFRPPEEVIQVFLDRPFVYALVDTRTGMPLFAGIFRSVKKIC